MQIVTEIRELLRAWRNQDRIRAAPGVGNLLNLEPDRRVLVRRSIYHIRQRAIKAGDTTLEVTYQLIELEQSSKAQLCVSLDLARPTHSVLSLVRDSSTIELFHEDVRVLAE